MAQSENSRMEVAVVDTEEHNYEDSTPMLYLDPVTGLHLLVHRMDEQGQPSQHLNVVGGADDDSEGQFVVVGALQSEEDRTNNEIIVHQSVETLLQEDLASSGMNKGASNFVINSGLDNPITFNIAVDSTGTPEQLRAEVQHPTPILPNHSAVNCQPSTAVVHQPSTVVSSAVVSHVSSADVHSRTIEASCPASVVLTSGTPTYRSPATVIHHHHHPSSLVDHQPSTVVHYHPSTTSYHQSSTAMSQPPSGLVQQTSSFKLPILATSKCDQMVTLENVGDTHGTKNEDRKVIGGISSSSISLNSDSHINLKEIMSDFVDVDLISSVDAKSVLVNQSQSHEERSNASCDKQLTHIQIVQQHEPFSKSPLTVKCKNSQGQQEPVASNEYHTDGNDSGEVNGDTDNFTASKETPENLVISLDEESLYDILMTYRCKVCSSMFVDKQQLIQHYQEAHYPSCGALQIKQSTKDIEKLSNTQDLKVTAKEEEPADLQDIFKCSECSQTFKTSHDLEHHKLKVHGGKHKAEGRGYPRPHKQFAPQYPEQKGELIGHRTSRNSVKEVEKSSSLEKGSSVEKRSVHPPKVLADNYWLDMQKKQAVLEKEIKKNIRCPTKSCKYKFSEASLLDIHLQCHGKPGSGEERTFFCHLCSSKFDKWVQCQLHLWKAHSLDVDLFTCGICHTYKTCTNQRLLTHQKIHSQTKDYICTECGKGFRQLAQLLNHVVYHRQKNNEKVPPWASRVKCSLCDQWLTKTKSGKLHMQTAHEKIKRYGCTECSYRSCRKFDVTLHMRIHTKERPHACNLCPYRTSDHNALRRHRKTHAKDENKGNDGKACEDKRKKVKYKDEVSEQSSQDCSFTTTNPSEVLRKHTSAHNGNEVPVHAVHVEDDEPPALTPQRALNGTKSRNKVKKSTTVDLPKDSKVDEMNLIEEITVVDKSHLIPFSRPAGVKELGNSKSSSVNGKSNVMVIPHGIGVKKGNRKEKITLIDKSDVMDFPHANDKNMKLMEEITIEDKSPSVVVVSQSNGIEAVNRTKGIAAVGDLKAPNIYGEEQVHIVSEANKEANQEAASSHIIIKLGNFETSSLQVPTSHISAAEPKSMSNHEIINMNSVNTSCFGISGLHAANLGTYGGSPCAAKNGSANCMNESETNKDETCTNLLNSKDIDTDMVDLTNRALNCNETKVQVNGHSVNRKDNVLDSALMTIPQVVVGEPMSQVMVDDSLPQMVVSETLPQVVVGEDGVQYILTVAPKKDNRINSGEFTLSANSR
ncbi:uncharacterized protein LOC143020672 [Oratosquilla oratoria]|uniref:uncharacterized protein LOC143020672 n=1 Tax=Oratosquilla oratoria TaxID=337810 RepID=UPI003F762D73